MKHFIIVSVLFVTVSSLKHHSLLPHTKHKDFGRTIQNYFKSPENGRSGIIKRDPHMRHENSMMRKFFPVYKGVPVFIITKSKTKKAGRSSDLYTIRDLFDENGMVYLTKHGENGKLQSVQNRILNKNALPSDSFIPTRKSAGIYSKPDKSILRFMNDALNKKLIEMNNSDSYQNNDIKMARCRRKRKMCKTRCRSRTGRFKRCRRGDTRYYVRQRSCRRRRSRCRRRRSCSRRRRGRMIWGCRSRSGSYKRCRRCDRRWPLRRRY